MLVFRMYQDNINLQRMFRFFSKPIVPVILINSGLNQEKTINLMQKLKKVNLKRAKAIGVVVEIDNHMPVQIDKLAGMLQKIRKQHKLSIFGFCHSRVSAQSYYLLSHTDRIFTMPSTIFELHSSPRSFSTEQLLKNLGINKKVLKSDEKLIGTGLDNFTSASTSKYLNQKLSQINQRLYQFSIGNRLQKKPQWAPAQTPPDFLLGQQAISRGYADQYGNYFDVLKNLHPECQLHHVRIKQKISTRTLQLLFASPIIIVLFFFKVLLKYTIIVYLWMSHSKDKQK